MNRRPPSPTLSWFDLGEIERYAEDGESCELTGKTFYVPDQLRESVRKLASTVRELCVERDRRERETIGHVLRSPRVVAAIAKFWDESGGEGEFIGRGNAAERVLEILDERAQGES